MEELKLLTFNLLDVFGLSIHFLMKYFEFQKPQSVTLQLC